jgi:hypothetical protein
MPLATAFFFFYHRAARFGNWQALPITWKNSWQAVRRRAALMIYTVWSGIRSLLCMLLLSLIVNQCCAIFNPVLQFLYPAPSLNCPARPAVVICPLQLLGHNFRQQRGGDAPPDRRSQLVDMPHSRHISHHGC